MPRQLFVYRCSCNEKHILFWLQIKRTVFLPSREARQKLELFWIWAKKSLDSSYRKRWSTSPSPLKPKSIISKQLVYTTLPSPVTSFGFSTTTPSIFWAFFCSCSAPKPLSQAHIWTKNLSLVKDHRKLVFHSLCMESFAHSYIYNVKMVRRLYEVPILQMLFTLPPLIYSNEHLSSTKFTFAI